MASIVAAWPAVALGEVMQLERRPVRIAPDGEYAEIGIYSYGRGIFHKTPRTGLEVGNKDLFLIQKGDFIFQITFAWEGAVALASEAEHGMYGSVRFPTFRVNEQQCYAPFLLNYFRTQYGREQLVRISPGSAGRNRVLNLKRLPEVTIPLPPLDEQRRIVAHIEALAARIEQARGLRREALAEAASFVASMHLELADTRRLRLNDVLVLDEEHEDVITGKLYPQVGVRGFGGGLFARAPIDATQTTYKAFNRLYEGAIVLSQVKGWEGAIAGCSAQFAGMYTSPEYRTFRCKPNAAIPQYMAALVTTPWFWSQLRNLTRGVGARRERTRPEQFLALEMSMPSTEQQAMALNAFADLQELKQLQTETEAELDALLPSVLDKAFRGEL